MNSVAALQLFLFQVENKNVATRGRQENSYASILTPAENKQTSQRNVFKISLFLLKFFNSTLFESNDCYL